MFPTLRFLNKALGYDDWAFAGACDNQHTINALSSRRCFLIPNAMIAINEYHVNGVVIETG
jgi:hypothetical protein